MEPERDLLQVAAAQYAFGVLPGSVQRRQQHGRKDGDDRDDDQQLDQRETLPMYPEFGFPDGHWVMQGAWVRHRLKRMRGSTKLCAVSGCIKLEVGAAGADCRMQRRRIGVRRRCLVAFRRFYTWLLEVRF